MAGKFSDFLSRKGIKHIRTAYFHPQANRGFERFIQSLKNGIRTHLFQGCTFQTALNQALLHYRVSQHVTTQASPASLMLDHAHTCTATSCWCGGHGRDAFETPDTRIAKGH